MHHLGADTDQLIGQWHHVWGVSIQRHVRLCRMPTWKPLLAASCTALSAICFSGTTFLALAPPDAVISTFDLHIHRDCHTLQHNGTPNEFTGSLPKRRVLVVCAVRRGCTASIGGRSCTDMLTWRQRCAERGTLQRSRRTPQSAPPQSGHMPAWRLHGAAHYWHRASANDRCKASGLTVRRSTAEVIMLSWIESYWEARRP